MDVPQWQRRSELHRVAELRRVGEELCARGCRRTSSSSSPATCPARRLAASCSSCSRTVRRSLARCVLARIETKNKHCSLECRISDDCVLTTANSRTAGRACTALLEDC